MVFENLADADIKVAIQFALLSLIKLLSVCFERYNSGSSIVYENRFISYSDCLFNDFSIKFETNNL